MKDQVPGSLTASRITTLPSGAVAEVAVNEKTEAFGRWFSGGSWSPWRLIATGARDVSVAPLEDGGEPAALVSVVAWTPTPPGTLPVFHVPYQQAFYRLGASGITPADLQAAGQRRNGVHPSDLP